MNAEHLLDSKRIESLANDFANTWRNKRAKYAEKVQAFQVLIDVIEGAKQTQPVIPAIAKPQPAPKVEAPIVPDGSLPASGTIEQLTPEQRAAIFDEPLPAMYKATPEQKAQAEAEARTAKREQLRALLPQLAMGRKGNICLPLDFPVADLPSYLNEIGGYGVTDKMPENLALKSKYTGIHFDAATGMKTQAKTNLPDSGWYVELIKVG